MRLKCLINSIPAIICLGGIMVSHVKARALCSYIYIKSDNI